jgi:cobalt transporter subunit CbtB
MQTSAVLVGERVGSASLARRAPALAMVLLGGLMLYVVGFLGLPTVHNATHDTRHAAGFPCH